MNILTMIKYFAALMLILYVIGVILVWIYDFKKNAIYRRMQYQIRNAENLPLSMAVLHAKTYKIMQDYKCNLMTIERVQQFILENMLFIGRSTLKNQPMHSNKS